MKVALNLMQQKWYDLFVSDISSNADVHMAIEFYSYRDHCRDIFIAVCQWEIFRSLTHSLNAIQSSHMRCISMQYHRSTDVLVNGKNNYW